MEFRFNVNQIFNQPIVRVNSNLLPTGFRGDRRAALDTATKIAEIINEMGMASAKAQGLSNPVTTAQKLRQSDQYIYLLGDPNQGRNGSVIGLLKVGKKSLYVFDTNGQTQMVNAPCVLDFYVHESRQRSGLGKDLFHTMLQEEQYVPEKMAVDRPSDKLLGFLRKHYGLQKTIPQMNNFVVYDGFFESSKHENNVNSHDNRMHITASPNTALFGPQFINDEQSKRAKIQQQSPSATSIPLIQNSPVGRYAAPRPMCSMAECLSSADIDPSSNKPNPSNPHSNTAVNSPITSHIAINKPVASNTAINSPIQSNTAFHNQNLTNIGNIDNGQPIASNSTLTRTLLSKTNLIKPAPSKASLSRERAGLPTQVYNQPHQLAHMQANQNEPTSSVQAQYIELNPAEPVRKSNTPDQEFKSEMEQPPVAVENYEVYQEVCPKCSTTFPSSRSSAMKVSQSKQSLNHAPNDAIIHSTATTATGEPNSEIHDETSTTEPYRAVHAVQIDDELDALNVNIAKLQIQIQPNHENNHHHHHHEIVKHHEDFSNGHHRQIDESKIDEVVDHHQDHLVDEEPIDEPQHIKKPTFFPLSKQHTGLKNISYNVGIAVSPTNKMEFNQEQPESFGVLKINRPIGSQAAGLPSHDNNDTASVTSSAGSAGGGDGFTDQGYFDLKFYHNKLW